MEKKMSAALQPEIKLAGIDLGRETESTNGQAEKDRAELWQRFQDEGIADKLKGKTSSEIILVSYRPRRPPTSQDPFRYYMGMPVGDSEDQPEGIDTFTLPAGSYHKESASGNIPECVKQKWAEINSSDIQRSLENDYEVYNENVLSNAEGRVDIYIS